MMYRLLLGVIFFHVFYISAVDFAAVKDELDISNEVRYTTLETLTGNVNAPVVAKLSDDSFKTPSSTPLIIGAGDLQAGIRINLTNSSPNPITKLLSIEFEHFQKLDIIVSSSKQSRRFTYTENQNTYYYSHSIFPVIPVTLVEGESAVVNFYMQNDGQIRFPLFVRSDHNFLANLEQRDIATWALLGVMLAFVLLNLFNTPIIRDATLFFHAIFVLLFVLLLFHDYGYARIPFWHAYFPYSKLSTRLLQGLMILFGILFADSSFKQFSPPSLVRNIYKSFFVIVSIATLATPFIQNWKMLILFLYATLALLLVTITVSIFLIYKRQYAAFYLLFGWIFVAVGAFTYFLTSTGYLPHTFYTTHSMQMGASLGFVIFALSLTNNLKQSINKKLEEKEVALDSMKTAQNLLEQFVQAISHEIRTPLNGIVGNISLIHPTSPQQQTVLNSLENESTRLATLLSSILDINALLEQTDDKQAHYFNATDLLQEVIRLMTHFIQKNNNAITLEQNVDSCIIEGKKPLFIKILIGLIFNVIHHAKSSAILLRITEEGGKCTITVRDDGCGIAPDTLQNIQQIIDNPPAPKTGQNTMTRVSISEIVHLSKKLHGQIKIFSELGRGTTAVLTFPTAPVSIVKQLEKTPAFQYKTGHKNGRTPILIVDDEPINLRILTAFLEQEKYTVEIASNGEETIKSLAKATPGLILMDVMLPDISGIELVKEIRKEHDKLALPILFVSARSDIKTLKNAYQNGGNGFIVKPIDRHALMYQVEMWFELSRTHKQNYE